MRGRAEVAGGESDSVLSFGYFFLQEIFSELACAGCWEHRGEQNIFFFLKFVLVEVFGQAEKIGTE